MLSDNVFYGNAGSDVGGVQIESGGEDTITLTNNTFYGNEGTNTIPDFSSTCNAVLIDSDLDDTTPVNIYNNILWNNPDSNSQTDLCVINRNGDVNLYNNHIQSYSIQTSGGTMHSGNNIKSNPLFVNPANGDFHLQAGSPCRNTGLNGAPGTPFIDFEGQNRIQEGTVDRGADEYGNGTVAVPTMAEWGVIILIGLLGMASIYSLRRQRII